MPTATDQFDAVIVGGGPAGLSAALSLGRARRRVLVATDGPARNAPADAAHNVFTRDGTPPAELLRIGREQLAPYDVTLCEERVVDVQRDDDGRFNVTFTSGTSVRARGIVLAIGVRDVLPDVPGMRELWGAGVYHCPYCHGWELSDQSLAIYAREDKAMHLAQLIRGWSRDVILFSDGPSGLSDADRQRLDRNGVVLREEPIARLVGSGGHLESVVLESGESIPRAGLYVSPDQELGSDLPRQLGCTLTPQGKVETDFLCRTSVPRVFAAGDVLGLSQSVIAAAASGTMAGAGLNMELLEQEFVA